MLQPTRNLVSITPKFESDQIATNSGILLYKHESYKRRTTQGIVKLVGPETKEEVCIGDYVFYSAYDGTLWYDKGEILIMMPDEKVLGKLVNIPETGINGLYCREKIDKEKNKERLKELVQLFYDYHEISEDDRYDGTKMYVGVEDFTNFLSDKIDAYGAYFEVPMDKAIELITDTIKEADWARGIEVGGTEQTHTDLYKDEKRTCDYCGEQMKLLRDRSTTTVFYKCPSCGRVKDRKLVKGN